MDHQSGNLQSPLVVTLRASVCGWDIAIPLLPVPQQAEGAACAAVARTEELMSRQDSWTAVATSSPEVDKLRRWARQISACNLAGLRPVCIGWRSDCLADALHGQAGLIFRAHIDAT